MKDIKMNEELVKISKQLSYWLRHHPENIGLKLEKDGWVSLDLLLQKANEKGFTFNKELIELTVAENDKQRFAFNEDKTKIRANQGHSADVKITFIKKVPPSILYHGTALKYKEIILKKGLLKMNRHHVHLSDKYETAFKVGQRHGKPIVFTIDTREMVAEGIEFYMSTNGVWLVDYVDPKYFNLSS